MAKRKKASWVGPVNPADAETGIVKPAGELTGSARVEAERMSPRPVVVPKDKKVTTERKIKKVDPKTGGTYEVAEHLKESKEPVQKRERPKRKPLVLGGQTVRAPKTSELKRGVTVVATETNPAETRTRRKKVAKKTVVRDARTGRARAKTKDELTTVLPRVEAPARKKPRTLAPGAGPQRTPLYIDPSQPAAQLEEGTKTVLKKDEHTSEVVETSVPVKEWVGGRVTRRLKGLAVPHKVIAPAVNQALQHLDNMAATRGTTEHHSHLEAFNTIHPTILGMDATIHNALGVMHNHIMHPKHNSSSVITQIRVGIADRLSEGKKMETQRAQRQGRK